MNSYDAYAEAGKSARYGHAEGIQFRVDSLSGPVSIDEAFSGQHENVYITVPGFNRPFIEKMVAQENVSEKIVLKQGRLTANSWNDIRGSLKETADMWRSLVGNDDLIEMRSCLGGFGYMTGLV